MNQVTKVRPENIEPEIMKTRQPVLLGYFSKNARLREYLDVLEKTASRFDDAVKVCFMEACDAGAFSRKYEIEGSPTFLVFRDGQERGRMLGKISPRELVDFIIKTVPSVQHSGGDSREKKAPAPSAGSAPRDV